MKIRVTKQFSFDMAHALHEYDGLCKNIHGHTYHLSVTLLGEVLDDSNSNVNGLVVDFSEIKKIVKSQIIHVFDHALLLKGDSPIRNLIDLKTFYERVIYTDYQPSCENLLIDIKNRLNSTFPEGIELVRLRLDETPTSYSEWFASDNQ